MPVISAPQKSTIVRNDIAPKLIRTAFSLGSWIAPRVTVERAVDIFCTPSNEARQRAVSADDGGALSSRVRVGAHDVQVYRWGDPSSQPYVLLAHGWSGFGLRFLPLVNALRAAGFAVVAFDQPGHGRSSGATATLPEFARCIGAVGGHFGRAAAVIGHSMGGAAAAIALRDGLAADRAVLIAPPADLAAAADRFADLVGLAEHLRSRLHRVLEARASVRLVDLEAHRSVGAIGKPALIVHDLADGEVPWSEGERYARYWPASRMLSTNGLGHHRILGDTRVIGAVLDFLRGEIVGERVVSTPDLPFGFA
ncbi:MAG TPA: alpha/beta fold hydrolase [Rhodanobacteraceae bacterium]|jgi:pimeloyl-ACP methyl ester carboxylesterase|nr:alpha/beta fold hydrolase [Rhodanobacteraceae bacterium]